MVTNPSYVTERKIPHPEEVPMGWIYADELRDYRYTNNGIAGPGYEVLCDLFKRRMPVTSGNLRECSKRGLYLTTNIEDGIPREVYPEIRDRVVAARAAEKDLKKSRGEVYDYGWDGFRVAQEAIAAYLEEHHISPRARALVQLD